MEKQFHRNSLTVSVSYTHLDVYKRQVIVNDLYLQWILQPSYETIAVCGILILAIVLLDVYKRQGNA